MLKFKPAFPLSFSALIKRAERILSEFRIGLIHFFSIKIFIELNLDSLADVRTNAEGSGVYFIQW